VLEQFLVTVQDSIPVKSYQKLNAAAYLELCDLAYGNFNDELRTRALKKALQLDWKTCFWGQGFPSTIRAFLGPRTIDQLRNRRIDSEEI
jgi:hypothetical protein